MEGYRNTTMWRPPGTAIKNPHDKDLISLANMIVVNVGVNDR